MRNVREIVSYLEQKAPLSWQSHMTMQDFWWVTQRHRWSEFWWRWTDTFSGSGGCGHRRFSDRVPSSRHLPATAQCNGAGRNQQGGAGIDPERDRCCLHAYQSGCRARGVNDLLAEALGLMQTKLLLPMGVGEADGMAYGIGRVGMLDAPLPLLAFGERVKRALHAGGLRLCDAGKSVSRVAVGGALWQPVAGSGCLGVRYLRHGM